MFQESEVVQLSNPNIYSELLNAINRALDRSATEEWMKSRIPTLDHERHGLITMVFSESVAAYFGKTIPFGLCVVAGERPTAVSKATDWWQVIGPEFCYDHGAFYRYGTLCPRCEDAKQRTPVHVFALDPIKAFRERVWQPDGKGGVQPVSVPETEVEFQKRYQLLANQNPKLPKEAVARWDGTPGGSAYIFYRKGSPCLKE